MRAEVKEALSELRSQVSVTNQIVAYSKSYVLKNFERDTLTLLRKLLEDVDARMPNELFIHRSVDTPGMIKSVFCARACPDCYYNPLRHDGTF